MNRDKIYDIAFDNLISHACSIYIDETENQDEKHGVIEFSKEHQEKMKLLFKKERSKLRLKKFVLNTKRAIACVFILITIVSIPILSVKALRIKFFNYIIDMRQTHTDITFSEGNVSGEAYKSELISFDYIPLGFKLEKSDVRGKTIYLKFKSGEQYFTISKYDIDGSMGIDTENAIVKKIAINNQEALYSSNDNINILVWHDNDYSYKLSGNIFENEFIKIAESMK